MANLLVVDDALFMRVILKDIIEGMGHQVAGEASDGFQALDCLKRQTFDLVTMDLNMPRLNGLKTIAAIREIRPDQRIVVCSAKGMEDQVVQALQLGVKGFITKPFENEQVMKTITEALA